MRVLLLSQAYPPFAIVGALRARKVAQMFSRRGHHVTVITERLADEAGDVRPEGDGIVVRTVDGGMPYRLRLVALRNRIRGTEVKLSSWDGPQSAPAPAIDGQPRRGPRALLGAAKRLAIGVLRLPDDQQQLIMPSLRVARRVMRDGVDIVYTTAPSFSTHLVGLLLRRRGGLRWIAEFRDPWTVERRPSDREEMLGPTLQRVNRWLERRCLSRADVIVAVTESVGRQLAAKLPPDQRGKIVVAMSGIEVLRPPRQGGPRSGPYRIVYAGSFYHDRDPRPFLEALAGWMAERGLDAADVQVDFAGRCRHYADVSVEQIVSELGLDAVVRFHDWLPHEEIQCMLGDADLVLLLARSQPAQVPNKLFDYLGARTPILAVVDAGGESARILDAVGGQYVVTAPEGTPVAAAEVGALLGRAYEQRREVGNVNEEALAELSSERQFGRLAAAIGA